MVVQRSQPMYNLTVAAAHTFFVGDQQWLVHNCNPTGKRPHFWKQTKDVLDDLYDDLPCPYCGEMSKKMDIEHIDPWEKIKQGAQNRVEEIAKNNDLENLAKACPSCNRSKQDEPLLLWLLKKMGNE